MQKSLTLTAADKPLYMARVMPEQIGQTPTTLDAVSAILETLRQFRKTQVVLMGSVVVTCTAPQANQPYYEVRIWREE